MHTSLTLTLLQNALKHFHDNKAIFVELGVWSHFKLPKLHSLNHYIDSIKLFGTTDKYDTQYSERLHINFTKDAYRATNHKDEFPQMTLWLERKEKVQWHEAYIACVLARRPSPKSATFADGAVRQRVSMGAPTPAPESHFHIAKTTSVKAVSFSSLVTDYDAIYFRDALTWYIVTCRNPALSSLEIERQSARIYFCFSSVQVFHKIKFAIKDLSSQETVDPSSLDVAHVKPPSKDKRGKASTRPIWHSFDL